MHEGYKKYLASLQAKGLKNPMPEKEWMKGVGINEEVEHVPFIARKSANHKNIVPTLSNHGAVKTHHPLNVNLMDKPKKPKAEKVPRVKKTLEEIKQAKKDRQKKWYKSIKGEAYKPQLIERISLEGYTDKQKSERKAMLKRMRHKMKKEALGIEVNSRGSVCNS